MHDHDAKFRKFSCKSNLTEANGDGSARWRGDDVRLCVGSSEYDTSCCNGDDCICGNCDIVDIVVDALYPWWFDCREADDIFGKVPISWFLDVCCDGSDPSGIDGFICDCL